MGDSQIIFFTVFGAQYLEEFKVCRKTIPETWNVVLITDMNYKDDGITVVKVDTPEGEMKVFYRIYIDQFIKLDQWDQVWFCDCDVLFLGDLLAKYKDSKYILVSQEPMTTMEHDWMNRGLTSDERLLYINGPAINGGLFCIPKAEYAFFENYRTQILEFMEQIPHIAASDQQVLNRMFHRRQGNFRLFPFQEIGFPTRGFPGKLVDHYMGYIPNKVELMKKGYEAINRLRGVR